MNLNRTLLTSIVLALPGYTSANPDIGKTTYDRLCMACHSTGAAGAPKVGDKAKWKPLLAEPQWQLTAHGYVGVRGMPARGGDTTLSLEDFSKAVVYMANQSGGKWKEPDAALLARTQKEVDARQKKMKAKKQ
jgi:cytochrome c5